MKSAPALQRKEYVLIDEVVSVTKACVDIKRALFKIAAIIERVLGFSKVVIITHDEDQLALFAWSSLHPSEEVEGSGVNEGIAAETIKRGLPIVIPKTTTNVLFPTADNLDKATKSYISTPIIFQKKVLGALCIEEVYKKSRSLDNECELLTVIGSIISQRFRSFYNLQSVTEKFNMEKNLLTKELKTTYSYANMIGKSKPILDVFDQIDSVANSNATILIRGESGTGKELVAHAIHYNSLRADKPFVKVNCAALPENLIESELFGHEKGSFTDAIERKIGRFELANKGTLFLDEIGELKPHIQVKLLRALQEKHIERVGGTKSIKVDVRIICATNMDLEEALSEGDLREDFYYRINVFSIDIPPLRVRKSDIVLLADHFIEKYSRENNKIVTKVSKDALELLTEYQWPGNVRELENCIERAVILCNNSIIQPQDLPATLHQKQSSLRSMDDMDLPLEDAVNSFEKELIINSLKRTRGNKLKAAKLLKTTNRIIGYKIQKYDINPVIYKNKLLT